MKALRIHYTPRIELRFSGAELKLMLKLAQSHYDGTCKDAAAERLTYDGNRPGFLRGMVNASALCGSAHTHILTFRQVDTLAKIMEIAGVACHGKEKALSRAAGLVMGLSSALKTLNEKALEAVPLD